MKQKKVNVQIEVNKKNDVEEKLVEIEEDKVESKEQENIATPSQVDNFCNNGTALTVKNLNFSILISWSDNEFDIDKLVPERVFSDTDNFEPDDKDITSEDLEEEQEVQKILECLLKHPVNLSDTESCPEPSSSTSDSETSVREEDHKSIVLSTDESDIECIERAHTKTRRYVNCYKDLHVHH